MRMALSDPRPLHHAALAPAAQNMQLHRSGHGSSGTGAGRAPPTVPNNQCLETQSGTGVSGRRCAWLLTRMEVRGAGC